MKTMLNRIWPAGGYLALMVFLLPNFCNAQEINDTQYRLRARRIVAQMTLEEKIAQLHGVRNDSAYRVVPGLPRLEIPGLTVTNGPAGLGPAGPGHSSKATALPAPIALASTWDTAAAREYGRVVGKESAAFDNLLLEAPDINIARTPYNGRTFEGYGEDPYLTGRIGVSFIQGAQSEGVMAEAKHFAGNNQEDNRRKINAVIDERTLHEIYLPAFKAAVQDGRVATVMSAYNKLNGYYCSENNVLMNLILRRKWGFKGFVTSDFDAVKSTVPTALHGVDVEMPTGKYWGNGLLKGAVLSGEVPESVIDEKLVRRYGTMMRFGLWNKPGGNRVIPEEDAQIALRLAAEGMVLLKNDKDLLPLNGDNIQRIALIGPYSKEAKTGGGGSSYVKPVFTISPLKGIREYVGDGVQVSQYDGKDIKKSVALAKQADVVLLMLGNHYGEGKDRPITLGAHQDMLAKAVLEANPRTVVVLKSGGPVLMPWVDLANTILEAWYPGQMEGYAIAKIIFGEVNPSGKLPITFPVSKDDLPQCSKIEYPGMDDMEYYAEGIFVGYRWYDEKHIEPLFPFGYGLSYTTFKYSGLSIDQAGSDRYSVTFTVTNTGKRPGAEVAQLYIGFPSSEDVPQPPRQLKGFQRLALKPGQSSKVQFLLDGSALSYWDTATHQWKVMPGTYCVYAAASSRDIRLKGSFTMK